MVAYTKQGRYDDAIQVGIKALENKPTDEAEICNQPLPSRSFPR